MKGIIFSIDDIVKIAIERQNKEEDFNICVSGNRGTGKSWLLFKFFLKYNRALINSGEKYKNRIRFNPFIHQVYCREDVMKLLEGQRYGIIFDDEAVNSSYKRNFNEGDQKILIQMLNMYRDNFNIYGMAIPKFFSLDKDLRDMVKMHIHVIRRGLAIVHVAENSSLYSTDVWNTKYNQKIEENFNKTNILNPNKMPPYNKMTTFKGYLHVPKLTKKQERLYKTIKRIKRKIIYEQQMKADRKEEQKVKEEKVITEKEKKKLETEKYLTFADKVIALVKSGELTTKTYDQIVKFNDLSKEKLNDRVNRVLRAENYHTHLANALRSNEERQKIIEMKNLASKKA